MSNVILTELQQNINQQHYGSAQNLLPLLIPLFSHKKEMNYLLHHLQDLLEEHDPSSMAVVTELKNILVG
jgi:hypothetical protein